METKVLIIGSKGMLGRQLIATFSSDTRYSVIGWDRDEVDITDRTSMERKILASQPKVIINAVGYNAVDKAEESDEEFEKAKQVNSQAPKELAEISQKINATFIHYVSDYLFDGEKGEYVEDDMKSPINRYGLSKSMGEDNVQSVGGKYYLIRTSKLFGPPAETENAKKSFFEIMLEMASHEKELKGVDGERSCFTYTPDLAKATKQLLEGDYSFGIYHIVNDGPVTWYEGLLALLEIKGITDVKVIPVSPKAFPRPAKRADSTVLISTKFPKLRHYKDALKEWLEKNEL